MPGGKSPGPSIKDKAQYEDLIQKGLPKMQAAAISNASVKRRLMNQHAKATKKSVFPPVKKGAKKAAQPVKRGFVPFKKGQQPPWLQK